MQLKTFTHGINYPPKIALVLLGLCALLNGAASMAQTFMSALRIDIPATGSGPGPASPYPSNITVSGLTGTITKVTVTLDRFNHEFPGDVDIMLVGPGGQNTLLLSDAGGGTDAVNATLTFDDAASTTVVSPVVSGTYRPTNRGADDTFGSPAPPLSSSVASLAVFNGTDPNGTWSLYVVDDDNSDAGNIAGGWAITITTAVAPPCTPANQPTVTLVFNNQATVMGSGVPTITVPNGPNQQFQVLGGTNYDRKVIVERINGYEIAQRDQNTTGVFNIQQLGLFSITVTNADGCSRTVQGRLVNP
jgi:subtilisin-like proprotein convertase family protein